MKSRVPLLDHRGTWHHQNDTVHVKMDNAAIRLRPRKARTQDPSKLATLPKTSYPPAKADTGPHEFTVGEPYAVVLKNLVGSKDDKGRVKGPALCSEVST